MNSIDGTLQNSSFLKAAAVRIACICPDPVINFEDSAFDCMTKSGKSERANVKAAVIVVVWAIKNMNK